MKLTSTFIMAVVFIAAVKLSVADEPKSTKECREAQIQFGKAATATAISGGVTALAPHPALKAVGAAATAYGVAKTMSQAAEVHRKCGNNGAQIGK